MLLNARTVVLAQYRTQLILLAIEDITEAKLLEVRTEKFINMASHELKTPITSIMAFMQILEKRLKQNMDKPTGYIMSRLIYQLNVLGVLIGDLLDVRKIKEGALIIKRKYIGVDSIIDEAVTLIKYMDTKHEIVSEGSIKKRIFADKERIIQVVTNLLYNAVKYSPEGSTIYVNKVEKAGHVIISVQDSGIGIKESDKKHMFQSYFTAVKDRPSPGFGLGLYICADIIRLHNGKIWFKSKLGKGSTFYFSLPIKKPV